MTRAIPGAGKTFALAASLDMTAATALAQALLAARGEALTLDASAVRRLGGQCLQLLLAARMAWAMDGVGFEIADPSPEFSDAVALMGADDLITTVLVRDPS